MTDTAIAELVSCRGLRDACQAVGAAQASYYRRHRTSPPPARSVPIPHRDRHQPRALSQAERDAILDVLHSDRFVDMAPAEVWAALLDEGVYLGPISTFYRLLRQAGETRERRRQATHPATVKPELVAYQPNSVWSWDIVDTAVAAYRVSARIKSGSHARPRLMPRPRRSGWAIRSWTPSPPSPPRRLGRVHRCGGNLLERELAISCHPHRGRRRWPRCAHCSLARTAAGVWGYHRAERLGPLAISPRG